MSNPTREKELNPKPVVKDERTILKDLKTKFVNLDSKFFAVDSEIDEQKKRIEDAINNMQEGKKIQQEMRVHDLRRVILKSKRDARKSIDLLGHRRAMAPLTDEEYKRIYRDYMNKRLLI